jgi:hemerythrin-like domain-containing protein
MILRRGLDVVDGMGRKLEDGERIEIADVRAVLHFFRTFGDEYHQNMEENILFPALLRAIPEQTSLRLLVSEHGDARILIAEIEEALISKRGIVFFQGTRRLSALLRNHFDKEDHIFSDQTERLSRDQDSEIADRITKIRQEPQIQANFSRLEWKYVSKPDGTPLIRTEGLARARASAGSS